MTLFFCICSNHLEALTCTGTSILTAYENLKKGGMWKKWGCPLMSACEFCDNLPWFSKLSPIIDLQILHGTKWSVHLLKDTKREVYLCCMPLWTLHNAQKQRLIPATDSSGSNVSGSSIETKYPRYHSLDKKQCFFHVKFETSLVTSLTRKYMPNRKGTGSILNS
jgi:hypothetical protein